MDYYGNNDYRNYLAHYGRKGMRKGKHLPGTTWWKDIPGTLYNQLGGYKNQMEQAKINRDLAKSDKESRQHQYTSQNIISRGGHGISQRNTIERQQFYAREGRKAAAVEKMYDKEYGDLKKKYDSSLRGRLDKAPGNIARSLKNSIKSLRVSGSKAISAGKKFASGTARKVGSLGSKAISSGRNLISGLIGGKKKAKYKAHASLHNDFRRGANSISTARKNLKPGSYGKAIRNYNRSKTQLNSFERNRRAYVKKYYS